MTLGDRGVQEHVAKGDSLLAAMIGVIIQFLLVSERNAQIVVSSSIVRVELDGFLVSSYSFRILLVRLCLFDLLIWFNLMYGALLLLFRKGDIAIM